MDTEKQATTQAGADISQGQPKSLTIADKGIKSGNDFAKFMSALMTDLIGGRVTPQVGNAACNAGGKLLKAVDMQMKYGTTQEDGTPRKVLHLTQED